MKNANPFPIANEPTLPGTGASVVALLPKVRGFVANRVSHSADAEDLSQEILLRILQGSRQLSDETRLHGWVWQIAKNTVIDYYRRRNERMLGAYDRDIQAPEPVISDIDDVVASWLVPMIDELPATFRDAVRMSEIEGYSQADVAARLSISLSGAKSRIQRGRLKLREALTACCHLNFDREGRILSFQRRGDDCSSGNC